MSIVMNTQALMGLLQDFHELTGLRIGVYDSALTELCAFPKQLFCLCEAIKATPQGASRCQSCDQSAYQATLADKNVQIYRCHAGLTEATAILTDQNSVIGYIMIGQFLSDEAPQEAQWAYTRAQCGSYVDIASFEQAYKQLPRLSQQKIRACAQIMKACGTYIWLEKLLRLKQDEEFTAIHAYIQDNLDKPLCAHNIAKALGIPRNNLFAAVKRALNISLGRLVTDCKINYAKELLQRADLRITEVASLCGYDDYNYFSRVFRTTVGTSPSQYRNNLLVVDEVRVL